VARDPQPPLKFCCSVKTTGVYCRLSCAARLPKPENVQFHATCEDAEKSGIPPCKPCKPNQASLVEAHAEKIAPACRLIESSETPPGLELLAQHVGLSAYHFHRAFKATTGLTPKEYAAAHRDKLVRITLSKSDTVTLAIYNASYNSNSRFYETSNQVLGMTPSNYCAGGSQTNIRFAVGECSLGSILVAQSDRGICAILLGDDPDSLVRELQDQFPKANLIGGDAGFERLVAKVSRSSKRRHSPRSSPRCPRNGLPATRLACGAHALAAAISCHRVVRHDGALSDYRWGVERKRMLLEKEAHA